MDLADLAKGGLHALKIGKAAEHLVVADLLLQGKEAFLSDQGMPFDVVVVQADRLIRVQVKAACFARNVSAQGRRPNMAYSWSVRRRGKSGKATRLSGQHCDVVALVALDARLIAYVPLLACSQTVGLRPDHLPGRFGFTIRELASFDRAAAGFPSSLATKGRGAKVRRDGQLSLIAGAEK